MCVFQAEVLFPVARHRTNLFPRELVSARERRTHHRFPRESEIPRAFAADALKG